MLSRHRLLPPAWVWALILAHTLIFSVLSVLKHSTFHSFTLDLGIMSQVTWNTAHGRMFETSLDRAIDTKLDGSYLGNHVRPIFLLLAPLHLLWPDSLNPIVHNWQSGVFSPVPYREQIDTALAQIPPRAGVATIKAFGSHLAHRRHLIELDTYPLPLPPAHLQHVDYVLLDLVDCRAVLAPDQRAVYAEMVREVLDTPQFGVRYWSGCILLLERGVPAGPESDEVRAYVERLVAERRPCWP